MQSIPRPTNSHHQNVGIQRHREKLNFSKDDSLSEVNPDKDSLSEDVEVDSEEELDESSSSLSTEREVSELDDTELTSSESATTNDPQRYSLSFNAAALLRRFLFRFKSYEYPPLSDTHKYTPYFSQRSEGQYIDTLNKAKGTFFRVRSKQHKMPSRL